MPQEIYIRDQKLIIKSYLSTKYNVNLDNIENVDSYLDFNLRNLIALKIWSELLEDKLPSGPQQYLNEIISNFNQIIILGLLGFKIPVYMLIRRSIENLVAFLYYKDHSIEFLKKEYESDAKRKYTSAKDFREYIEQYPFYEEYKHYDIKKIDFLIKRFMDFWNKQYVELSKFVHGTNIKYLELTDYLDEINLDEEIVLSLNKSIQDFSSLINSIFILFFFKYYIDLDKSKKSIIRTAIEGNHGYKRELQDIFNEI